MDWHKLITIKSLEITIVHLPHYNQTYATLCGLDGDDPDPSVDQTMVDTSPAAKVNCYTCIDMYDICRQFNERDLDRLNRR